MGRNNKQAQDEAKAQLQALEAQFYRQFSLPEGQGQTLNEGGPSEESDDASEEDAELVTVDDDDDDDDDDNTSELDDDEDLLQSAQQPPKARRVPEMVVFQEPSARAKDTHVQSSRKQFMSSKIEDINKEPQLEQPRTDAGKNNDDEHSANDRKLQELLATTLFAPGTGSSGKKRKLTTTTNETLARIKELSSADTIGAEAPGTGWAERQLKAQELGKVPARIRAGLRRAAAERRDREIATQKELGLWNPKIHKQTLMTRGSATERGSRATQPKRRERGIGSGVGKFRGGAVHLSEADIQRIRGKRT